MSRDDIWIMGEIPIDLWNNKPSLESYITNVMIPHIGNIAAKRNRIPGAEKNRRIQFVRMSEQDEDGRILKIVCDEGNADIVNLYLYWSTVPNA